ncbi:hypothetical protein SD80_013170 [Scytonema tolypothrichoides VB-61278]|nr:hypothetical protein SD80_013170 [Scytonema tolypothrichoides VB-61278]
MEAFGHLYIPMPRGTLFRDNFYVVDAELYTSHYAGLGISSPVIRAYKPLQHSNSRDVTQILKVLQAPSALAKVFCGIWERFDRQFKDPKKLEDVWPITVAKNPHDFASVESTKRIVLRSEENNRQNKLIVQEAQESFRIVRAAFSEDLTHLSTYLNLLKRSNKFCVEINLPNPQSLQDACKKELHEIRNLERDHRILSALESHYDFQARSKYLDDSWANFARATVDSLCAIRAVEMFFQESHNEHDQSRFTLKLFQGPPTFRGTISDREIAYVNTAPWQPGMMGVLHVHRFSEVSQPYWRKIRKNFAQEIESMHPIEFKFSDAIALLEDAAIEAIHKAQIRSDKGKADLSDLRNFIQSVRMVKTSQEKDIAQSFDTLRELREVTRDTFREVFYGLDQNISKAIVSALKPLAARTAIQNKAVDPLSQLFDRLEEILCIIQAMPEQAKYNFPNADRVQIFEKVETYIDQVETYIQDDKAIDPDVKQALDDLKKMITDLQQRHPQATEEEATAIVEAEFEEIKHSQPQRWENLRSLKRLWNGVKQGSLKVGEHFAEETPWGKGVIGFLEGVMNEVE